MLIGVSKGVESGQGYSIRVVKLLMLDLHFFFIFILAPLNLTKSQANHKFWDFGNL